MKMMTKELVRLEERNAVYEVSGNRKVIWQRRTGYRNSHRERGTDSLL